MSLTDLARMAVGLPDRSLGAVLRRRLRGGHEIDPWGLDVDLVALLAALPPARLTAHVAGVGLVLYSPEPAAAAAVASLLVLARR